MSKRIIVKQLKDLTPNPENPREISDKELEMLKKSLDTFGDLDGFIWNRVTEQLIGAHQRSKVSPKDAAVHIDRKFDEPTKTGTVAEGWIEINGERHKYREVEVDATREKAMNIAANKHGGKFDNSKLAPWLLEIDSFNVDMDLTGFTLEEIEEIVAPFKDMPDGLTDPDAVPEVPKVAKTKRGELWILGNHRVLCGDATDKADVERLTAGEKVDMVLTDPPYNQSKSGGGFLKDRPSWKKLKNSDLNDFNPTPLLEVLDRVGAPNVYIFTSKNLLTDYISWAEKRENWDLLVMQKRNPIPTKNFKYLSECEWIVFSRLKDAYWNNDADFSDYKKVKQISVKESEFGHPTEKQVALIEEMLRVSSQSSDNVTDFYLGTGTTLIACEKTGRRCFGMEIEPLYIDVILSRWAKFTGKDPVRESDGKTWSSLNG
jgi:DNA modification methylase